VPGAGTVPSIATRAKGISCHLRGAMELIEAFRRVFLHHARLIVTCVLIGALAGLLSTWRPHEYTSSVRVMLGPQGSGTPEEATAISDGARAVVTSPGIVAQAVEDARAERDPTELANGSIALESIGSSGIVQLEVSDTDPAIAAAIANTLANGLVERWIAASGAGADDVTRELQAKVDQMTADIATLDTRIARQNVRLAEAFDDVTRRQVQAARDATLSERDGLVQQRLVLEAEISRVLAEAANTFVPRVVDPAMPPARADPVHRIPIVALGALLGFLLGAGVAATIETFRPTLVGDDAISDALGAPVLGGLSLDGDVSFMDGERLPLQVRLAATRAEARAIELVPIDWPADAPTLGVVAENLQRGRLGGKPSRPGPNGLAVHPFDRDASTAKVGDWRTSRAMVAVTPSVIERSKLREIVDLQNLTAWPLIGLITFTTKSAHGVQVRRNHGPTREGPEEDADTRSEGPDR
jgi:capsular polysaccharide biosynthesis protein